MLCVIFCRVNVERVLSYPSFAFSSVSVKNNYAIELHDNLSLESPLYSAFFVRARCCTGE